MGGGQGGSDSQQQSLAAGVPLPAHRSSCRFRESALRHAIGAGHRVLQAKSQVAWHDGSWSIQVERVKRPRDVRRGPPGRGSLGAQAPFPSCPWQNFGQVASGSSRQDSSLNSDQRTLQSRRRQLEGPLICLRCSSFHSGGSLVKPGLQSPTTTRCWCPGQQGEYHPATAPGGRRPLSSASCPPPPPDTGLPSRRPWPGDQPTPSAGRGPRDAGLPPTAPSAPRPRPSLPPRCTGAATSCRAGGSKRSSGRHKFPKRRRQQAQLSHCGGAR